MPLCKTLVFLLLIVISILVVLTVTCQKTQQQFLAKVNGETINVSDFLAILPSGQDIETPEETHSRYQDNLQRLISRRLFIQEAKKLGLTAQVQNSFDLNKRTMLTQKLFDHEIIEKAKATPAAIQKLYTILPISVHLRLITVATFPDAELIEKQLKAGMSFESCANKFSQHPSSKNGGDVGFGKLAFLPEPIRNAVENMQPGTISQPYELLTVLPLCNCSKRKPNRLPVPPRKN